MQKYLKIHRSDHFSRRQQERSIDTCFVRTTIEKPDGELPARSGRRKFWKRIDGTKYIVDLREIKNGHEATIITTYHD